MRFRSYVRSRFGFGCFFSAGFPPDSARNCARFIAISRSWMMISTSAMLLLPSSERHDPASNCQEMAAMAEEKHEAKHEIGDRKETM